MFTYLFAGVIRTDLSNQIHYLRITAKTENEARAKLSRQFVLIFAGRIKVSPTSSLSHKGVNHA
ncbi:hypothetical protein BKG91_00165 [Rodentibacter caecimuris]|uniref:Uncharacterized protein n=1 Tax=Rodentibacter caecimuris TaxID=1796644 RepID=A0A9X8VYB6_9PAST|nr:MULTISPECIES: host cell division inhibitor Icd-like protein [Pasteurellaceae]MCR1837000.1 host cell division inhibitor Icd-like protein [Pasteurella caecimuris]MCU0107016.1 host cell division inhibitor Icd-like protein [Pasteurella caecimuris]OOF70635.1 hypothetical protein BKG90_09520 [Rodentibacter heylii]OOF76573.1 hypothetical protein BKG91_00165 [Rodentibacter heylii]OOF78350.1 hypothetical protein BKG99_00915 [Rodentibacter heylii]